MRKLQIVSTMLGIWLLAFIFDIASDPISIIPYTVIVTIIIAIFGYVLKLSSDVAEIKANQKSMSDMLNMLMQEKLGDKND